MSDTRIRELGGADLDILLAQQRNAYPGFFASESISEEKMRAHFEKSLASDTVTWFGAFADEQFLGSMRVHDFVVNVRGVPVPAGGVGAVAVSLYKKKQRVAKELMDFYLDYFLKKNTSFCLLWPFRPDFYRRMGFGYGGPVYRYTVPATSFPDSPLRKDVEEAAADDTAALGECYHRYASKINGMVLEEGRAPKHLSDALDQKRVAVFRKGSRIDGFIVYQFTKPEGSHPLQYDLKVTRLIYTSPESLRALSGFLRSQQDQIRHVVTDLPDDSLHFLLEDPRDTHRELYQPINHRSGGVGIGIMYRVIDIPRFFEQLGSAAFGAESLVLKLKIEDSFLPSNSGAYVVAYDKGKPTMAPSGKPDVTIALDIGDFSSLIMGAVTFEKLFNFGRVTIDRPSAVDQVTRLFATDHKPNCLHPF